MIKEKSVTLSETPIKTYNYLLLMTTLFITSYLTIAVLQNRLVSIDTIYVSAAVIISPLASFLGDVIAEVYGYKVARQLLWCGIVAWWVCAVCVEFVIRLHFPAFWTHYSIDYDYVMKPLLRSIATGTFALIVGSFLNIYMISKLKILARGRYFWLRSIMSTAFGEFCMMIIVIFGIFGGRMAFSKLIIIASAEYFIMLLGAVVLAYPAVLLANFLKLSEGVDVYDYNTNFNPFKFKLDDE